MAVRDRNLSTWQAYVLTMSIVSLILLIGAFFLWRANNDANAKLAALTEQNSTNEEAVKKGSERVQRLRSMLGVGDFTAEDLAQMKAAMAEDPLLGQLEREFDEDMKLFDPSVPATQRHYRTLPRFLQDTLKRVNQDVVNLRSTVANLQKQMADVTDRETKARKAADDEKAKAIADLEETRRKYASLLEESDTAKKEIEGKYGTFAASNQKQVNDLKAKYAQLETTSKAQLQTIADQARVILEKSESKFESPHGKIVGVYSSAKLVFIDLGSEDGLQVGTRFSVFGQEEPSIDTAKVKARLLVTKIINEHMAQANVLTDNYRTPVVEGDLIASPAWRKGRSPGYALVGLLDADNDGIGDRNMIVDLITRNGGQIDAEISPTLTVTGPGISSNTNYIVMGSDVRVGENATKAQQDKAKKYNDFINQAKSYDVRELSIDRLITLLRTDQDDRTVPLGDKIRGSDFPVTEYNPGTAGPGVSNGTQRFLQRMQPAPK